MASNGNGAGAGPLGLTFTRRVHVAATVALKPAGEAAPDLELQVPEGEPPAMALVFGIGDERDVYVFSADDLVAIEQAIARWRIRASIVLPG